MLFEIDRPTVPVTTGEAFPVRRIYCVGQNYRAHAKEMGADPDRQPPFFFQKPASAIAPPGAAVPYPPMTEDLHHEVELVVALGPKAGGGVQIFGHAVGLDLTRRDLQKAAKAAGGPWDMAKGFDFSAPCGPITPAEAPLTAGAIGLAVNGETRQSGDLSDMIWSVAEILDGLAGYVALAPGDIIFTGTPEGVGPVRPGDRLEAEIDGLAPLSVRIAPAS